jgi:hypothetical protein
MPECGSPGVFAASKTTNRTPSNRTSPLNVPNHR